MKQYEKKYGKNLNAERLSKMINKANVELKENNEKLVAEKGITNGIKKRRLMLQEMSGFEISGNVHFYGQNTRNSVRVRGLKNER